MFLDLRFVQGYSRWKINRGLLSWHVISGVLGLRTEAARLNGGVALPQGQKHLTCLESFVLLSDESLRVAAGLDSLEAKWGCHGANHHLVWYPLESGPSKCVLPMMK